MGERDTKGRADKNTALFAEANRAGAWFHARKTRPIWAMRLERQQVVRTLEGEENVAAGAFLCRGEAGEIWPQSPASLEHHYQPTDEIDAAGWRKYVPAGGVAGVMAVQVGHAFEIEARWGRLAGKAGDFLLKRYEDRDVPYPSDVWIVDQALFRITYERIGEGDAAP